MHNKYYGKIIWTNHALDRLSERGFSQQMAWEAFKYPDKKLEGKGDSTEFQKRYGNSRVTVIAKPNEKNEWVVLSCWIDPPLPGTDDHKRQQKWRAYQKSTGIKRWILAFLRQLGL